MQSVFTGTARTFYPHESSNIQRGLFLPAFNDPSSFHSHTQCSNSKNPLGILCLEPNFPALYYNPFLKVLQQLIRLEVHWCVRKHFCILRVEKKIQHAIKENVYMFSSLLPSVSPQKIGGVKISESRREMEQRTRKAMSKDFLWTSLFFSSLVLLS